jgi:hypothetical protein
MWQLLTIGVVLFANTGYSKWYCINRPVKQTNNKVLPKLGFRARKEIPFSSFSLLNGRCLCVSLFVISVVIRPTAKRIINRSTHSGKYTRAIAYNLGSLFFLNIKEKKKKKLVNFFMNFVLRIPPSSREPIGTWRPVYNTATRANTYRFFRILPYSIHEKYTHTRWTKNFFTLSLRLFLSSSLLLFFLRDTWATFLFLIYFTFLFF